MALFKSVVLDDKTVRFGEKINASALRDFASVLEGALSRGHKGLVLDFTRTTRAYPEFMLPMIGMLDSRRRTGRAFVIVLPTDSTLRQLFLNSNWAHYLDPESQPRVDLVHHNHLALRRYRTHNEQQEAVNAALSTVLRNIELTRDLISALDWTMNEITDNVLNHAQSEDGGLVQVSTFRDDHRIKVVVADSGRGIPAAMRETFQEIRTDVDAVERAMRRGVTSIPDSGQGNGLYGSHQIARCSQGSFRIASGRAEYNVFKDHRGQYKTTKPRVDTKFSGTMVMLEMKTDADFDLTVALDLPPSPSTNRVSDIVDFKYTTEGGELLVRVENEQLGTGTRHAGVELRRKCSNLLNAEPTKILVLDWSGVQLVASSFADEAVGKLFVELGPTTFMARVRHANTAQIVASLLDRAIMQRVSQATSLSEEA